MYDWNKKHNPDVVEPLTISEVRKLKRRQKLEAIYNKYGKFRCFMIVYCFLATVLILMVAAANWSHRRVDFMGNRLRLVSIQQTRVREDNQAVSVTILQMAGPNRNRLIMRAQSGEFKINYMDINFSYNLPSSNHDMPRFTFSDGTTFYPHRHQARGSSPLFAEVDTSVLSASQLAEWNLMYELRGFLHGRTSRLTFMGLALLVLLFLSLGLVSLVYPHELWYFSHRFDMVGGEPTDYAIGKIIFGGMLNLGIACVIAIATLASYM